MSRQTVLGKNEMVAYDVCTTENVCASINRHAQFCETFNIFVFTSLFIFQFAFCPIIVVIFSFNFLNRRDNCALPINKKEYNCIFNIHSII